MKLLFTTLFSLIVTSSLLFGQESKLAQQYYKTGEYEKAGALYEKLYNKNKNDFYFNRYIECQLSLERFEESEKAVKREIKRRPKEMQLFVTYGNILERQFKDNEAKEAYRDAIKNLKAEQFQITKLANAFQGLTKYDLAVETYERGAKLMGNDIIFAYNLGNLYRQMGDHEKMMEHFLNSLQHSPTRLANVQTNFQRFLNKDDYVYLKTLLFEKIQEDQEATQYLELLAWVFIQNKDYRGALRQLKALDRRMNENGGRVFNLAQIASSDKNYDVAISAYDYIQTEKGPASTYYIEAKRNSLRCSRNKVVDDFDYTIEELKALELEYETFLDEFGRGTTTASIVAELANLEGLYLNDTNKAISLLNELINYIGLDPKTKAKSKLQLADYYLMNGEIWESTLLYSQVDKDFKDDLLGHEARYKNAKLSYFNGDFEWAQSQFKVLKASTSKLIANDALDLSVFIMDNLGLDTTAVSLGLYAEADLLVFQNKLVDAFVKLDSLLIQFPEHSLEDDVYYLQSKLYMKKRDYINVEKMLKQIIEKYPEEIRADNALFELAELYEIQFGKSEEAKALYEKIFLDFSNSTFAIEARKRFRILRGDDIQ